MGGEADDPLRRPGRRARAEAAAADRLLRPRRSSDDPLAAGKLLVDQLVVHGADTVFCVPGESYLAGPRRAPRRADPPDHLPARGRRGEHGGRLRQADRPPGDLLRHARARRDPRVGRRAHRVPGLDAADPARRPGRARDQRDREAFQEIDYRRMFGQLSKWVAQIDRADRIPEYVGARLRDRVLGPARARSCSRCPRTCSTRRATPPTRCRRRPVQPHPAPRSSSGCARCSRRPSGRWCSSAAPAGRRRGRRRCASSSRRTRCRRARRSAARMRSTTTRRATPATSASASTRSSRRASAMPTCCSSSARGSGEMTTSGYTLLEPPTPRQTLVHVHPGAEELGRVYRPELAILSGMEPFAAAVRELRVEPRWGEWTAAARADYERAGNGGEPMPGDARPRASASRTCRERLARTRSSRTAPATSPSGCTASGATTAIRSQLAPTSGAMGYGVPAAVAAKLRRTRTDRSCASPATATS